jgi:hypothetical protein
MGKKRRLKSASAKFGIKHSAHPRAKLLATLEEDISAEPASAATLTVNVEKAEIPTLKVKAPEAAPSTTTIEAPTPAVTKGPRVTKKKVAKVEATPAPKAAVKKTTTTKKTTSTKKTATTRKRSTKAKTKTTTT